MQLTVIMCAAQMMKTVILENLIGFHIDQDPGPILMVQPTIEMAEAWSKSRLTPTIRDSPALANKVSDDRSRDAANTILGKSYTGGDIAIVGANAPSGLAARPRRVVLMDEVDRYPASAGTEGDPCSLAIRRAESFWNSVIVMTSTPTVKGLSRIESEYEQTDQRKWFCPCPRCGHYQVLMWSQIKWPDKKPEEAWIECEKCEEKLDDKERYSMVMAGEWRPTAKFTGKRGYWLNGIATPFRARKGFNGRLHQMAASFLESKHSGKQSLKTWANTFLAETWEEESELAPDHEALLLRCEPYEHEIPDPVVYLTAAVDVQHDRLELEVIGWAVGEESYGIFTKKLFGNPFQAEVWNELDKELSRTFEHPCGAKMRISCALIDSGGQLDSRAFSQPVYRFTRPRQGRYIFASKGSSDLGAPLVVGRLQKNGIMLQHVGTDVTKGLVYERLQMPIPGPGYCHFPQALGYDDEYFKQLTAEVVVKDKGKRIWKKKRARNEALDIRAMNIAAYEIRNPNLKAISENLRKSDPPVVPEADKKVYQLKPEPPRKQTTRRRVGFVKW